MHRPRRLQEQTDPQQPASRWGDRRAAALPVVLTVPPARLAATTRRRRPGSPTLCCYRAGRPCWTWKRSPTPRRGSRAVTSAPVVAVLTACAPRGQDADQVATALAGDVVPAHRPRTFTPSRPACRSWSTRRSPKQPPNSQPSTAGASTRGEPNERSVVRPQPCSRRPPSTGTGTSAAQGLLLRLDPAMHRRLRLLAVQEDTTVQQLGVEALEMLLQFWRG